MNRTGDDTNGREWERTRKMGVNTLAFRMIQNGIFYMTDADCVGVMGPVPWSLNRLWLDVLARSDLWDIIRSLQGKVTIILTTHYMEEAEALSDRVAIMADGKLLICETPERIKEAAGTDHFEQAFVRIVKGVEK